MDIGFTELLIIVVIIFVLFGAGKLPKAMHDLGIGIGKFKQGIKDADKEESSDDKNKSPKN